MVHCLRENDCNWQKEAFSSKESIWREFILRLFRRTFGEMFFGAWHEFHNQTDSITHGGSISIPSYPLIHTFTVWWVMTNTICLTHSHGQTTLTELCICLARKNGETVGKKSSVYQQIIVIIWMFKKAHVLVSLQY